MLERAAARLDVELSSARRRRARRAGHARSRVRSSSVIRWPARRSTPPPPASSVARPIVRSPPRCPTATSTGARGTSPPPPSARTRPRRRRLSRPACAAAIEAHTPRRRRIRTGGAADRRLRAAGAPVLGGGRCRLARRPRRPRRHIARRGSRRHRRSGALLEIDRLAGHIATRRGPVMRGYAILTAAAQRADPESVVAMLREAAVACFYAGNTAEMLAAAERARAQLPENPSIRARFLAATALGMAQIVAGDAASGAEAIHEAIALAESSGARATIPRCSRGWRSHRSSCANRHRPRADRTCPERGPRAGGGRGAAVRAQPDRARPGHHRPLGAGRGHLPRGDRARARDRSADRPRVRAVRACLAAGSARARTGLPGMRCRGAGALRAARDPPSRGLGDRGARELELGAARATEPWPASSSAQHPRRSSGSTPDHGPTAPRPS